VENGARFVEVTTEYVPFLHWDTHGSGHETVESMHKEIDQPIATLIRDLEQRGLLERTLVVIATEFSRDAMVEGTVGSSAGDQAAHKGDTMEDPKHYGLHRHFTGGSSIALFGGGIKKGALYGKTADERPCLAMENPVSVTDVHATIFHAMGISPKTVFDIENRPFYATVDGKGEPVRALFG
jgi:arylsulfatase A-like enzyme